MANDFYQIYRADVMRLAKTMVIKSEVSALATNRAWELTNGLIAGEDKKTWRYYMNIAGLYHSTNKLMQVRSLDTGEMIDFTVDNLKIHRGTAREYAFGSVYYTDLVARFPNQKSLILGILNPVDINKAIEAKEGQILWLDRDLIEPNEDNLEFLIQRQIDAFLDRWHVETYSITEDLYDVARLAILYANIPLFIMTARMKNSRTYRSHSFFIRQFLASNGRLDKFMFAMNKKQQLFFYRNLPYLHRYPGWKDSFDWLTTEVLEERNFPLADYKLIQNIENMPDETLPQVELVRKETTAAYAGVPETKVSVQTVLEKQVRLAKENKTTLADNHLETTDLMQTSKVSQLSTKVLESSVLDMTDSQVHKLEEFLINHWMYLAAEDRYRAIANIVNPRTGEPIQLTALDAFILFIYAYNRALDQDLPFVPEMVAVNVLKNPVPTPDKMFELASSKHVTMNLAQALWDQIPFIGSYISTEAFNQAITALHSGAVDQHTLASFQGNYNARAQAEAMAMFMFMDKPINLADGISYKEWLHPRGLNSVLEFTKLELDELWTNLLASATGMDLSNAVSLNDIHRAMIGIMERMSSYSVHFIREINDQPLKPLANKFIRNGDSDGEETGTPKVDILKLKELTGKGESRARHDLTKIDDIPISKVDVSSFGSAFMPIGLSLKEKTVRQGWSEMPIPYIRTMIPALRPETSLGLYDSISDIVIGPLGPVDVHLREVIVNRALSGLNLPDYVAELPHLKEVIPQTELEGLNLPDGPVTIPLEAAVPITVMDGFTAVV